MSSGGEVQLSVQLSECSFSDIRRGTVIATIYMQRIVDRERQQSTDSLDKIPLLKIISVVVFVVVCVNVRERQQSTETLGKIPLLKIISLVFVVVNVVVYVNVRERKQQSTETFGKIPLLRRIYVVFVVFVVNIVVVVVKR